MGDIEQAKNSHGGPKNAPNAALFHRARLVPMRPSSPDFAADEEASVDRAAPSKPVGAQSTQLGWAEVAAAAKAQRVADLRVLGSGERTLRHAQGCRGGTRLGRKEAFRTGQPGSAVKWIQKDWRKGPRGVGCFFVPPRGCFFVCAVEVFVLGATIPLLAGCKINSNNSWICIHKTARQHICSNDMLHSRKIQALISNFHLLSTPKILNIHPTHTTPWQCHVWIGLHTSSAPESAANSAELRGSTAWNALVAKN